MTLACPVAYLAEVSPVKSKKVEEGVVCLSSGEHAQYLREMDAVKRTSGAGQFEPR